MTDEIEIWKTRSFWLSLATAAAVIAQLFGVTIDADGIADTAVDLVPLITLALAYRERMSPKKRVVIRKTTKEPTHGA